MLQSAFRNLVNTQYRVPNTDSKGKRVKGTHLAAKAFLTYEEVLKQIKRDFCKEEADILIAYVSSLNLPTREKQIKIRERNKLRRDKRKADKVVPMRTREEIMAANKIDPTKKTSIYWNQQPVSEVVDKTAPLRVVKK